MLNEINPIIDQVPAGRVIKDKLTIFDVGAVSAKKGKVDMHYDAEETSYASASVTETLMGARKVALEHSITVPATSLDAYCKKNTIGMIDVLKVDVEGLEMPVFEGGEGLIRDKKISVIAYEFGTHQMARREYFKDFFDFFEDHGYSSYRLRLNGWAPVHIPSYSTREENFGQVNMYLAVAQQK